MESLALDINAERCQEDIRDSELLELLFDQVPCYISVQDREFTVIEFNRAFEDEFGDGLGRKCYQVYKRRQDPCPSCPVRQSFEDEQVHSSEETVTTRDGRSIKMLVQSAPIRRNGKTVAVMEVSTNIDEMRQLQTHLTSLGHCIAGISHSIKGILTGLRGGVYVVNSGLKKSDQERVLQGWSMVQRNVDRISKLALDILYYSKDRVPEKKPISLDSLLSDLVTLFEENMKARGITFEPELGPVGEIYGEPTGFHSMLVNLLENAMDACTMGPPREGKQKRVVFGSRRRGDRLALWVSDTGVGMDEDTRKNLFQPTFSTKGAAGTGLGLMVAEKVAREHGGSIEVASSPGQGSTFTVRLPVGAAPTPS